MISFTAPQIPTILAVVALLSACGGGGGSATGEGGFTASNTNTKPQSSSESSASSAKSPSTSSATSSSSKSSSSSSIKPPSGVDIIAPTSPATFSIVSTFPDVVFLTWEKSKDNIAVVAYKVYRDGVQIAETEELENYYADYTVAASKTYEYGVSAGDSVGNWSTIVTTRAATPRATQVSSTSSSAASISSSTPTSITSSTSSNSASSAANSTSRSAASISSSTTTSITSSTSSNSTSSAANSTSSSKASSSASSKPVTIGVSFEWLRPLFRENGTDIYEHEIARYELRYKLPNETNFTTVLVNSPLVSKSLADVPNNAYFEIATVDTNGAYSRFVPIHPL